tara:strand:- start:1284 stop:1628 length:345 start_codon:yes stop_codon:yes gene_type:complete
MKWPPVKCWTKSEHIKELRYFVAINYGGEKENRWVDLVSVLNGSITAKVSWRELHDESKWNIGWLDLDERHNPSRDITKINSDFKDIYESACLHPSKDSGLDIPPNSNFIRPWI